MLAFYFSRKIPDSKPFSFDLTDFSNSFPLSLPLILHFDTLTGPLDLEFDFDQESVIIISQNLLEI